MKNLFLCAIALMVFSCSSDSSDDDGGSASGNGTKIKTIKKIGTNGIVEQTTSYEYNSEGNVSRLLFENVYGETTDTSFEYDSNDRMISFTEVKVDAWDDIRTEIDYLEYEGDVVVKICQDITYENTTSSFDQPEVDKIEFEYNDSNQNVSLFTHFYQEDAEFSTCDDVSSVSNTEEMEFDANGNMTRYENSDYFWSPSYLTYNYDDKNHPLKNVKPDAFRKLIGASSVNNINSANEYNAESNELIGTISFSYTYNASNYPTVMERTYTSEGSSAGQTIRYEYTYY
ncbi:hypothetical protein [Winogradskyella pulchriflava]|uniref:YD repeat-containing protein n=1 Tax=Winogradskyella pulchriflava TaxID=1110688 RepID=A0ABV6Q707_9FLAO